MCFLCSDGSEVVPGNTAVVGAFDMVMINFSYSNMGNDPAFGGELILSIPGRYTFVQEDSINVSLSMIIRNTPVLTYIIL